MSANDNKPPGLFRCDQLLEGHPYRDVLTGKLVLVVFASSKGASVRWWNPVSGEFEDYDVVDHQLELPMYPSRYSER